MNLAKEMENDPILQFAPFALNDIKSNWQYLSEQSDEVAERIIKQIMEKCEFLSRNPKIGRERNDLILNLRQFPFKNFNIYYFLIENGVEIYRVLHSSRELLSSLKLLRPRHLPLVITIGDRDLNIMVSQIPADLREVFTQSAAEEIIHQRDSALRLVETQGGLALDVNASNLAPRLLETYLKVKERGLL